MYIVVLGAITRGRAQGPGQGGEIASKLVIPDLTFTLGPRDTTQYGGGRGGEGGVGGARIAHSQAGINSREERASCKGGRG